MFGIQGSLSGREKNPYEPPSHSEKRSEKKPSVAFEAIFRGAVGGLLWSIPFAALAGWFLADERFIAGLAIGGLVSLVWTSFAAKAAYDRFGRLNPTHPQYSEIGSAVAGSIGWSTLYGVPTFLIVRTTSGIAGAVIVTGSIFVVWTSFSVMLARRRRGIRFRRHLTEEPAED